MMLYVRSKSDPQQIMVPVQREVRAAGPGIMVNDIRTGRTIMDNGLFQPKIAEPWFDGWKRAKPPDTIPAARIMSGKTVRALPLCAWPEVARYKGSGSIDDASNFTCRRPE
jgi:hypothetical protein